MKDKINSVFVGFCVLVEIGCIAELTRIALKRNNDCYKAEMKLIEREADLAFSTIDNLRKEAEINELKAKLEKFEEES